MKINAVLCIFLLLICTISVSPSSEAENGWWNDHFEHRLSLEIPIDFSLEIASGQPIDTRIHFSPYCWMKNESIHSLRVVMQKMQTHIELESQIYNLTAINGMMVESCSLVFLIPDNCDGSEEFFVYYSETEKEAPEYPDHVSIRDAHFRYEPVPGYAFESWHYEILEEDTIPYVIAYGGMALGIEMTLLASKLQPDSTSYEIKNLQAALGSDFWYYPADCGDLGSEGTSADELISRDVVVDGNLMVMIELVGQSFEENIQSTVQYKYYYCPNDAKRLAFHVTHQITESLKSDEWSNFDGILMTLQMGGVKSQSIEALNAGEMLPYIHFPCSDGYVFEKDIDPNPRYDGSNWDIRVIDTKDDIDLGEGAWMCFDEGETGTAHAVILNSTDVIISGTDRNGIQMRAYESGFPNLPGLENNAAAIEFGRNSYESGGIHDKVIDEGTEIVLRGVFFSTYDGGLQRVQEEVELAHALEEIRPWDIDSSEESSQDERNNIDIEVVVPWTSSFPLGSVMSALTGLDLSYITAEIYTTDGEFVAGDVCRRIKFSSLDEVAQEEAILGKIKAGLYAIEWRNFTFWKSIRFEDIDPGEYVVKVFKQNTYRTGSKEYIGFEIVNAEEDTRLKVDTSRQAKITVEVLDKGNPVEDVLCQLCLDDAVISEGTTDETGTLMLYAPTDGKVEFRLESTYQGVEIISEAVSLGAFRRFVPLEIQQEISTGTIQISIIDSWGLPLAVDAQVLVKNKESTETLILENVGMGVYNRTGVLKGEYDVEVKIGGERILEEIQVLGTGRVEQCSLVFSEEFNVNIDILNKRGIDIDNVVIFCEREDGLGQRSFTLSQECKAIQLPGGSYEFLIKIDNQNLGITTVNIASDRDMILMVKQQGIPWLLLCIFLIASIVVLYLAFKYFDRWGILMSIGILVASSSLGFPWWSLFGESEGISHSMDLFIYPVRLVSWVEGNGIGEGELLYLPALFETGMMVVVGLVVIASLMVLTGLIIQQMNNDRYGLLLTSIGGVLFVAVVGVFLFALFELTNVGVGSIQGSNLIDVSVSSVSEKVSVFCSWGFGAGFYLVFLGLLVLGGGTVGSFLKR